MDYIIKTDIGFVTVITHSDGTVTAERLSEITSKLKEWKNGGDKNE